MNVYTWIDIGTGDTHTLNGILGEFHQGALKISRTGEVWFYRHGHGTLRFTVERVEDELPWRHWARVMGKLAEHFELAERGEL
jgi:hypothetical protein